MKVKLFMCAVFAGCMLGGIALADTKKGTVCSCDKTQITLQVAADTYIIQRTAKTTITPSPTPGIVVTVTYDSGEAQRKEGVSTCSTATPTPTPKSG